MIITAPDPYLLPTYRLSPFTTADVSRNAQLPKDEAGAADAYFAKRFGGRQYFFVENGRAAIALALASYNLGPEDVVTILTTTDNFYISGCVTSEIEKICRWSRKVEEHTRVLFVNHEFGYPRTDLEELKSLGFPIIEDCAYSFFSQNEAGLIGMFGDFTIYSFPKMFPLQIGGLLTAKEEMSVNPSAKQLLSAKEEQYVKNVLTHYLGAQTEIVEQRFANWSYLNQKLAALGCKPRLPLGDRVVPGVFLFSVPDKVDLPQLKSFLWERGVQCSIFYGEQSFFIPVHQGLMKEDLDYIISNISHKISA